MGVDIRRFLMAAASVRRVTEEDAYAYARVRQQLYMSTNCGETWTVRDTGITTAGGLSVDVNGAGLATGGSAMWDFPIAGSYNSRACTGTPKNLCQSSGSEYIYYSVNAGSSWVTGYSTTIYRKSGLAGTPSAVKTFYSWDQSSPSIACSENGKYICIGGAVNFTNGFISTDYGATWTETLATSSYGNGATSVDMSNDGKYTLVGSQGGLNRSVNSLGSITHDNNVNVSAVAVSGDGNVMYYSTTSALYRSYDHGTTWNLIGNTYNFTKLRASYLGQRLIGIRSGIIYYSADWGNSWTSTGISGATDIVINKFRKF